MTGSDDAEFNKLVQRYDDPSNDKIEVTEVMEKATVVEITVPIQKYPNPEIALLNVLVSYMKQGPRRALLTITTVYEVRGGNPCLIGTAMFTDPVNNIGEG